MMSKSYKGSRRVTTLVLFLAAVLIGGMFSTAYAAKKIIRFGEAGSFGIQKGLDPHTALGGGSVMVSLSLFDGLVRKEVGTGNIVPSLATKWKIASDWSYVDFFIRKGIKFHNGEALTADDVKFSFERAMRQDLGLSIRGEMTRTIKSVEKKGQYQVRIHTKMPWPSLLDRCATSIVIVPKDYITKVGDEKFAEKPVGTGPFKIISFEPDDYVNMAAVKNHWRQTPNYDELQLIVIKEAATRFSMLKTGELDVTWTGPAFIGAVHKDPKLKNIMARYAYVHTIVFMDMLDRNKPNSKKYKSPWQNPKIREAASLAINRKGIAKNLFGLITPWGNFLAPYHPGYEKKEVPPYDKEAALKLLSEVAGVSYPPKKPYVWEKWDWGAMSFGPAVRLAFVPVVSMLWEVGIKVKTAEMERGAWTKKHTQGELRGLGFGPGPWWGGYAHPASSFESHTIGAWAPVGRTFPELKTAFDKMVYAAGDKELAKSAQDMENLMFKVGYRTPLWCVNNIFAMGPKVGWFDTIPGSNFLYAYEYIKYKD
jgi:ABC-type transport system substrate-binding protein